MAVMAQEPGEIKGEPIGYIWFSPIASDDDNVIEMHICCKPGWEGRWLTRPVVRAGYQLIDRIGARYVVAMHDNPEYQQVLKKLGFQLGDRVNVLDTKELEHGRNSGSYLWRTRDA